MCVCSYTDMPKYTDAYKYPQMEALQSIEIKLWGFFSKCIQNLSCFIHVKAAFLEKCLNYITLRLTISKSLTFQLNVQFVSS